MPSPVPPLIGPLILALIVALLGRWSVVATLVSILGLFILAILVAAVDLDPATGLMPGGLFSSDTLTLLGRALVLTELIQRTLLVVYTVLGILFILTLLLPQSLVFVPLGLAILSPMSAALMLRPFVFGGALLLVVACGLAVIVQGGRAGSVVSAVRSLTVIALAMPLLVIAGWMLESGQVTFSGAIAPLIGIAFLILLAGFPFQYWAPPLFSESTSLVPSVVFGLMQMMYVVFCVVLLVAFPTVHRNNQFLQLMRGSAVLTLVLGSILVLTAPSIGRLIGYLLLLDVGATILSLSLGGRSGLETTLILATSRIAGLIMAGFGLGLIRRQIDGVLSLNNLMTSGRGFGRCTPLGVGLFVFGGLSLAGAPLTPGFGGRWAVVSLAAAQSQQLAVLLILSVTVGVLGVLRYLRPLLFAALDGRSPLVPESAATRGASILLLLAGVITTLLPQTLVYIGQELARLI